MKVSKEEKAKWIEDWKRSGKSAWRYAKENDIIPQTFARWVKLEQEDKRSFVEIVVPNEKQTERQHEILIEKGDIKIHIPVSVWAEDSCIIMKGLKEVI